MSRRVFPLYRGAPALDRLHLRVRWATCPFARIAECVPDGRVLEIGCGHGLFSNHLALTNTKREVLGIDIDEDKVREAERAAWRARGIGASSRFEVEPPGHVPAGPWDAIVVVDVLYLITAEDQRVLLDRAVDQLTSDGILIVKEMARSPRWKAAWNRVQEQVSVRILHITAGDRVHSTDPHAIRGWLQERGLVVESRAIDRHYPHPHHLILGRRRITPGSV